MKHRINLIGEKFERLEVIANGDSPGYVVCKCDCGTICTVRATNLTKSDNPTRSCGCLRRETCGITGKRTIATNNIYLDGINVRFKTAFQRIESKKINKNNKSGCRGVWFNPATQKYHAYIGLHNKLYGLGIYKTLDEASIARHEAEEKYYAPLVAQKNEYLSKLNAHM